MTCLGTHLGQLAPHDEAVVLHIVRHLLALGEVERHGGVGGLESVPDKYIVVLLHPVTTEYGQHKQRVNSILDAIIKTDMSVLWFWPNMDAGSQEVSNAVRTFREYGKDANFRFFKNMEPEDFLHLLKNSSGIVGNSSVAIRECSYLGVPAVNIGDRQRDRERGQNVIDVEYDEEGICTAINNMLKANREIQVSHLYGDGFAGEKIADILASCPLNYEKRLSYVDVVDG